MPPLAAESATAVNFSDKDPTNDMFQTFLKDAANEAAGRPVERDEPAELDNSNSPKYEQVNFESAAEEIESDVSASPAAQVVKQAETSADTMWVTDHTGKRRQITIDYSNKEAIKKAFARAAGMDKFKTERDLERKQRAELQKKFEELNGNFGELDRVFQESGARGLVERLGGQGSWEKMVEAELKQREHIAALSPEDKYQLQLQQREKQHQLEKSSIESRHKKMLEELETQKTRAAEVELQSRLTPSFEKHRVRGRLGDEAAEEAIDEAIWTKTMSRLAQYPEDTQLSAQLIDKEFRTISNIYKKVLDKQAQDKARDVVEEKKADAAAKAQLTVRRGVAEQSVDKQLSHAVKSGNFTDLLMRAFGK